MRTQTAWMALFCAMLLLVKLAQADNFVMNADLPPLPADAPKPAAPNKLASPLATTQDQDTSCDDKKCDICDTANASKCTECKTGYGVKDDKCVVCNDKNCTTCGANFDKCTECKTGYGVKDDKCVVCNIENCTTCGANFDKCTECKTGYGVKDGKCDVCTVKNCTTCGTNASKCTNCETGFQPTADASACVKACKITNCEVCKSENECTKCSAGFKLSTEGKACAKSQGASRVSGPLFMGVVSALAVTVLL